MSDISRPERLASLEAGINAPTAARAGAWRSEEIQRNDADGMADSSTGD